MDSLSSSPRRLKQRAAEQQKLSDAVTTTRADESVGWSRQSLMRGGGGDGNCWSLLPPNLKKAPANWCEAEPSDPLQRSLKTLP